MTQGGEGDPCQDRAAQDGWGRSNAEAEGLGRWPRKGRSPIQARNSSSFETIEAANDGLLMSMSSSNSTWDEAAEIREFQDRDCAKSEAMRAAIRPAALDNQ